MLWRVLLRVVCVGWCSWLVASGFRSGTGVTGETGVTCAGVTGRAGGKVRRAGTSVFEGLIGVLTFGAFWGGKVWDQGEEVRRGVRWVSARGVRASAESRGRGRGRVGNRSGNGAAVPFEDLQSLGAELRLSKDCSDLGGGPGCVHCLGDDKMHRRRRISKIPKM